MVFVTGDLHGNFERFKPKYFPKQARMTKQDIMICAGDFGGVWFGDSRDDETLDWLERLPFTLVFVCGNHENYDALERYPVAEWHGGKVHRVRPHVLHLMRGQIFELDGYRFFTMGGAKSHDIEDGILEPDAPDFEQRLTMLQRKPRARYRINHISWWAQELPFDEEYAEARRSLDAVGWQVEESCGKGFYWTPLTDAPLVAVVPPDFPWTEDVIPLERLLQETFLSCPEQYVARLLPPEAPRLEVTASDDAAILSMVAAGLGVSVLSAFSLAGYEGQVRVLPLAEPLSRRLGAAVKTPPPANSAVRYFLSFLKRQYPAEPADNE